MKAARWFQVLGAMSAVLIAVSCFVLRWPAPRGESAQAPERHASAAPIPAALRAAYVAAVQRRAPEAYRFERVGAGVHTESAAQGLRAELREEGVEVLRAPEAGRFRRRPRGGGATVRSSRSSESSRRSWATGRRTGERVSTSGT